MTNRLAIIVIGRNEGERLVRSLASVRGRADHIIYVDSGSTDGSLVAAEAAGVDVIELDMSRPFTAARARNAGFRRLAALHSPPDFVQFLDGDCTVKDGWLEAACDALRSDDRLAIVVGWLVEQFPEHSIYNAMCALEWRKRPGPITACGGIMMVRYSAFKGSGGFNESVIAAEDDELCLRIAKDGWRLVCLPVEMAYHDTAMTHFRQWWRRSVRAGHGFAEIGMMHKGYFRRPRLRAVLWGGALPALAVVGVSAAPWVLFPIASAYVASYIWNLSRLLRDGLELRFSAKTAFFLALSKFPNLQGMLNYYWRRFRGRPSQIIEHK